ncbi:siderophore ABC transporter substrate-binding protein [Maritimibacter alkaliphilus]|uniref:siderophore ABC transporter substrate-binding protein n=1 Tax=Maritimibacter alkaliphilus TaxID=404236 RepID=UPI001C9771F6|nr:siderophore ABC transporter substrate-binding protein [Maritimibacter alkaliphilus]MBY6092446.1 siderophore ABC transporter substrate-binding protein [Maritimibacter alkaliphilus]
MFTIAPRPVARLSALAATLATLAAAPAVAQEVTFDTAAGPMTLDAKPETIIALDLPAVDTLTALGVTLAGVPTPLYVDYLSDIEAPAAGTLFEPNYELIAATQPDLIIAGGRSQAQVEPLSQIAPTADMTLGFDAVADGRARLATYGKLTGTEAKAAELDAALEAKLEKARALVADHGNALILMTNGPKLSVYGKDSRFGWIHSELGWPQAVEDIDGSSHGEAVSFEYLAKANPDTLIVVDRAQAIGADDANARTTLDNELVHGTKAWQSGRVIFLPAADSYIAGGGIQSLNRTLDVLIGALETAS